jgi:hypothetical protein
VRGWRCDLLSSDRDLTALVGPTTRLLRPRATMADLVVEDEARVRATYGIEPHQYTDLAAMRGDPSDGLDGVRGHRPQDRRAAAARPRQRPRLYEVLHDLPPRVEAALRAGREQVERNLLLMAPLPNLPVDVDAAVRAGVDLDRLERTLEPARPGRRRPTPAGNAVEAPPPPPAPPPLESPRRGPAGADRPCGDRARRRGDRRAPARPLRGRTGRAVLMEPTTSTTSAASGPTPPELDLSALSVAARVLRLQRILERAGRGAPAPLRPQRGRGERAGRPAAIPPRTS